MYGILIAGAGFTVYFFAVLLRLLGLLADPYGRSLALVRELVWYSGMPVAAGFLLILFDLFVLLPGKRTRIAVRWDPPPNLDLTVVLTAYNDESSIGAAVEDFRSHPKVKRVIVVDNNSSDRTFEVARHAGAEVVCEKRHGYGHCVFRALEDGAACTDTR